MEWDKMEKLSLVVDNQMAWGAWVADKRKTKSRSGKTWSKAVMGQKVFGFKANCFSCFIVVFVVIFVVAATACAFIFFFLSLRKLQNLFIGNNFSWQCLQVEDYY